jgi:hypothetical protein
MGKVYNAYLSGRSIHILLTATIACVFVALIEYDLVVRVIMGSAAVVFLVILVYASTFTGRPAITIDDSGIVDHRFIHKAVLWSQAEGACIVTDNNPLQERDEQVVSVAITLRGNNKIIAFPFNNTTIEPSEALKLIQERISGNRAT